MRGRLIPILVPALSLLLRAQAPPPEASVVMVFAEGPRESMQQGSGVVVAPGLVATNAHVAKGARALRIRRSLDGPFWSATVRCMDVEQDLALLQVPGLPFPAAHPAASSEVQAGTEVEAMGFPGGRNLQIAKGSLTAVWAFRGDRLLQSSARCRPGSSGGGLFTREGGLAGITTLLLPMGGLVSFSIPVEWVLDMVARNAPGTDPTAVCRNGDRFLQDFSDIVMKDPRNAANLEALALDWTAGMPGDASAWNTLGAARLRRLRKLIEDSGGTTDAALQAQCLAAFRRATALDPRHAQAWNNLGASLEVYGRTEEARDAFRRAVDLQADFGVAWLNLGGALLDLRDFPGAAAAYARAVRLLPDESVAFARKAFVEGSLERWEEAREDYLKAVHLFPFRSEWWGDLAQAQARLGDRKGLKATLDRLRTLDPALASSLDRRFGSPSPGW